MMKRFLKYHYLAAILICLGTLFPMMVMSQAATVPYVPPARWSPDGSKVAIVVGNSLEVRDIATTQILYVLNGHTNSIPMIAWSPDGSMIATPSRDQTVKIWNGSDGQLIHTLTGHNAYVEAITWSSDGTQVFSWGFDTQPNLFIWEVKTGTLLASRNSGSIVAAGFSPNGERLALAGSLWIAISDALTLEPIVSSPRVNCCANLIRSLMWSPDGNTLVTGSINGLVTIWDSNTAQMLHQFQANPHYAPDSRDVDNLALSWVRAVTFGAGGKTILAVSGDGSVREWDNATGSLVSEAQISPLYTATWSPYGGQLAVWEPNAQEITAFSSEQDFDVSRLNGEFKIVVPLPSRERLQAIATACNAPAVIQETLTAATQADQLIGFTDQIAALPEGTIPPACAADLLAVAAALQNR